MGSGSIDDVIDDSELLNHLEGQPELILGIGEQVSALVESLAKIEDAMPKTMIDPLSTSALNALEDLYARLQTIDARRRELDIC